MSFDKLKKRGWLEVSFEDISQLDREMLRISSELGEPVAHRKSQGLCQNLSPISSEDAHPNSLSAKFSFDEFPLHVDTAHWATPCRYVLLGCMNPGKFDRKTLFVDFNEMELNNDEKDGLLNAPFNISNGRNSFYSTVLSKKRNFIRYDPGCMKPSTSYGYFVADLFSNERIKPYATSIEWNPGKIMIFDNWRILHKREAAPMNDTERTLYRVLVA